MLDAKVTLVLVLVLDNCFSNPSSLLALLMPLSGGMQAAFEQFAAKLECRALVRRCTTCWWMRFAQRPAGGTQSSRCCLPRHRTSGCRQNWRRPPFTCSTTS